MGTEFGVKYGNIVRKKPSDIVPLTQRSAWVIVL